MRRGDSDKMDSLKGSSVAAFKRRKVVRCNSSALHRFNGFALYEVLLGVFIFAIGVLALGRAVENCLSASALSAEEDRVRQILSNRMAEVQATPGIPDTTREFAVDTGFGKVKLVQKCTPAQLTEADGADLIGVRLVVLTVQWTR